MTDYRLRPSLESVEDTRDRLRRAAEAAEIGTFYCPLPLGRLYWNARSKSHFWLPPDTPDGEIDIATFYSKIHPDDRDATRAAVDASVAGGEPYDVEYRTVSPEGEVRWLRAKGSTSFDDSGRAVRFDGITIDISTQKQLESERTALIESERMLRVAAQSANEAKDTFIAAVSHELRAPLTAILAWVDLLAQTSNDADFIKNGIAVIRRNVLTQTRLIDDLLDTSRIRRGKFTVERVPLTVSNCLHAALQDIRPIADKKGIFVADLVAEEVHILGDGPRLRQVFANLLNNALKHTPRGGRILPALVVTGNTVRISIADTGAGIAADRLNDIFEPFVQIENPIKRDQAGLGLGLAISRSIVAMHGGDITAQSDGPGQGTTVTVILPTVGVRQSEKSSSQGDLLSGTTLKGKTVLLVEDDADTLEALALTFQLENAQVHTAASVPEARRAILHSPPDVIVSDLTMPGEDGYDFIKSLRRDGISIPAIALSGQVRAEDRKAAIDAGFDDHLSKPIDPAKLLETTVGLLNEKNL
ncbi:ATP-binding protein [Caballeronia sp. BCC1704]|uniref:hybrid sensor histidine kinase/response regulator n=1 Tax=Caballeronia sp. BCC1704 TaxID=2676300 RepID=UPI00158B7CDB|nr:ATP-binding protein [Caballeronia sp. BCC1704]